MTSATATAIADGVVGKGDVLAVARIAGIQAAKRTSELIPLCHPIMIGSAEVHFEIGDIGDPADTSDGQGGQDSMGYVDIEATVETVGPTGVEMEALTACSVAALTIYDMCKSRDRGMTVETLGLWHKSGGRSGDWNREPA